MSWELKSLDQLGYVSRGRSRNRPRDAAHLYGGPYPFIQTGDVKHSNLYITDYSQTYSEVGLAQSRLWKAGTLCITIAANIADTAILGIDACFPDSVIGFIPEPEKADARFIKYLFDALLQRKYKKFTQGAAQDNLSQGKLLSLKFPVPRIVEQKQIADTLSAYDDLIENNRRRIQLLEQAARLLYKEWFVNLRFPGHEHVKIKDGVPDGWEKTSVGEKTTLIRGRSYKSSELVETGGKPFVNLKCVARHGGFRFDGVKRFAGSHRGDQVVVPGDIIIAVTDMTRERHIVAHPARVPAALPEEAVFSMDTVKIIPNEDVDRSWFYYYLRFSNFSNEVREHATGTNVLHLRPKQITDHVALFPPHLLQEQFGETAQRILDQQDNLLIQTTKLARARDLLLPRLMNREIAV